MELVIQRCRSWIDHDIALVDRYGAGPQRTSLQAAATAARTAYQKLAELLTADLAPRAVAEEAFGQQRYALWVRTFLAAQPDLRELYDWGWDEFRTVEAELIAEAKALGGSMPEVLAEFAGPDAPGTLHSREAFGAWLQELLEAAMERLDGVHFDIPAPLRRIESRLTTSSGVAYIGPSRDLARPGRVWWSLPEDATTFPTWIAYSTAYHEGVPGHHLHLGSEVLRGGLGQRLNLLGGLSAGQEGWALYAERFMDELGLYEQPGVRLGHLFMQLLRAARVVLDIGLHLRLPAAFGDRSVWTPDAALALLRDRCHQGPYALAELGRYLGRPGQALAYKAGERACTPQRHRLRRRPSVPAALGAGPDHPHPGPAPGWKRHPALVLDLVRRRRPGRAPLRPAAAGTLLDRPDQSQRGTRSQTRRRARRPRPGPTG